MAEPRSIPAQNVETSTERGTYTDTDTYSYPADTYDFRTLYPYDSSHIWIANGIILCLVMTYFIILAIVFYKRHQKRKAWYGQMATHYREGGLPPWATATVDVGDGSVKSPLVSPSQGAYPENPTQVDVYGNLPTVPYSNPTGVTCYTAEGYHIGDSISPTPTQFSPSSPPTYGAPTPQGTPANASPCDSYPKAPEYVETSDYEQAPAYSGDPESTNGYSKEKK